jgi:hypothetical protein
MLKAFIATSVSILSLFSVSSIADAGSMNKKSADQTQLHLITKQSQSNVSASDLKGISQAIAAYYKEQNNRDLPMAIEAEPKSCFSAEVKSLKLVSISSDDAQVEAEVKRQSYLVKRISNNPPQWAYENSRISTFINMKNVGSIMLKKTNGKWKVSVASV